MMIRSQFLWVRNLPVASLAGSNSRFSMRRQSRRRPWWGSAQGLTGGLSGFQSHLRSCRQASQDPLPSAPTWASREGRLTPRQLASPAGGTERAPDRSHSPSVTQPFPPSLPTCSFCCKSSSGPRSQKGKTQSCESPEGGDAGSRVRGRLPEGPLLGQTWS